MLSKEKVIEAAALPRYVLAPEEGVGEAAGDGVGGARSLADCERMHVDRILRETGWNISRAASVLEVDRGTLYAKIKKYGLQRPGDEG